MRREIILDTETTGIEPLSGHRVVEIGCLEIIGGVRTGQHFHTYLNPERAMPEEAYRVHGLSDQFLKDKPLFAEIVEPFLQFLQDSPLVIHNAAFDMRFINAELERCGFPPLPMQRAVDTLLMARKKFPGAPASLDALCKRYEIDSSARTKHGALLDAELLSEVYIELLGGRQVTLALEIRSQQQETVAAGAAKKELLPPRDFPVSQEEMQAHDKLLAQLKKPLWLEEA